MTDFPSLPVNLTKVGRISLQFRASEARLLPSSLRWKKDETPQEKQKRKKNRANYLSPPPQQQCSIAGLSLALEKSKYELVGAYRQERHASERSPYFIARFVFAKKPYLPERWPQVNEKKLYEEMKVLCESMLWKAQIFSYPLKEDRVLQHTFVALEYEGPQFEVREEKSIPRPTAYRLHLTEESLLLASAR